LEGDLLVGLVVGAPVTSLWKIVKRLEVVVEIVISGVEEKLVTRVSLLSFVVLVWRRR
jgi:hypothetical protein